MIIKTDDSNYRNIANRLNGKLREKNSYLPSEIANRIKNIKETKNDVYGREDPNLNFDQSDVRLLLGEEESFPISSNNKTPFNVISEDPSIISVNEDPLQQSPSGGVYYKILPQGKFGATRIRISQNKTDQYRHTEKFLKVLVGKKKIQELSVGSIVKLNVNKQAKDFIVVNQGKPSSLYDESCSGTWLLMKDIYEKRQWHNLKNKNDYENSTIHSYLNETWFNYLDPNIRNVVREIRIPYRPKDGIGSEVSSGTLGLSTRVFLLSGSEVGIDNTLKDGSLLKYFPYDPTGSFNSSNTLIANFNNTPTPWWLRSPDGYDSFTGGLVQTVKYIQSSGKYAAVDCSNLCGIRPALVLYPNTLVDDKGNIIV